MSEEYDPNQDPVALEAARQAAEGQANLPNVPEVPDVDITAGEAPTPEQESGLPEVPSVPDVDLGALINEPDKTEKSAAAGVPEVPNVDWDAPQPKDPNLPEVPDVPDVDFTAPAEDTPKPESVIVPDGKATSTKSDTAEDGRWDNQKAETMAAVVQDPSLASVAPELKMQQDDVNQLHEIKSRNLEAGYGDRFFDRQARTMERRGEVITTETNIVLSPYEELYDLNAAKFAAMPTSEFMALAKDFNKLDMMTIDNKQIRQNFNVHRNNFAQIVDGKELVDRAFVKQIAKDGFHYLHPDLFEVPGEVAKKLNEEYDELMAEVDAIAKDAYDKPPRETNEAYGRVIKALSDKLDAKAEADKKARQDFLDSHKVDEAPAA